MEIEVMGIVMLVVSWAACRRKRLKTEVDGANLRRTESV
jgi:hypothetical protein